MQQKESVDEISCCGQSHAEVTFAHDQRHIPGATERMGGVTYAAPGDTDATADLRATAHEAGTAACIALLAFATELALETVPDGPERDEGLRTLDLGARLAAGEPVDPDMIADALMSEDEEGVMIYHQLAPEGPQLEAWGAVVGVLGYAAWHGYKHRSEHPNPLVEGYKSLDSLDFTVDPFVGVPGLDWTALGRATAFVREHASKAGEGWGQPLGVDDLRRAAGR